MSVDTTPVLLTILVIDRLMSFALPYPNIAFCVPAKTVSTLLLFVNFILLGAGANDAVNGTVDETVAAPLLVIVKLFELASTIVAALHVRSDVLAIAVNGDVDGVKLDV